MRWLRFGVVLMIVAPVACSEVAPNQPEPDAGPDAGDGGANCTSGAQQCVGAVLQSCVGDQWMDLETCVEACDPVLGCVACIPGDAYCEGNTSYICSLDGTGYEAQLCDPVQGVTCSPDTGYCTGACAPLNLGRAYIGCEYYAVVTANLLRYDFDFAVVVANASIETATVTIEDGQLAAPVVFDVAPGGVGIEYLPWDFALKVCQQGSMGPECNQPPDDGAYVLEGAYRIRATHPVSVYQFNPLDYANPEGTVFSYTNDSSLLLPVNALGLHYVVAAWPPYLYAGWPYPSMTTLVATAPDTTVTITTRATAGGGGLGTFETGVSRDVVLGRGDALELLSGTGDLTGSIITADKPIAVFGGHYATNIPENVASQDHLEEQMFPVETLSDSYVISAPAVPLLPDGRPRYIRIVAAQDQVAVDSDPPLAGLPTTLAQMGDFLEIGAVDGDYLITADKKILVAEYMVGQNAGGDMGDPAMALAVATDQYRTQYLFHAPTNYEVSYVNIAAPVGATVTLDGTDLTAFTPIGATGYGALRVLLGDGAQGNHHISSEDPFGITVYGYGHATSYWYPGGLDLQEIPVN